MEPTKKVYVKEKEMGDKEGKVLNNKKDVGANKCPGCGASEITYDIKKGKLICKHSQPYV